jgi:hypothetical protein
MTANLLTEITALEAQAAANRFLSEHLPDRFCADDPRLDKAATLWRVPVVLAYPFIGSVGEVGEIEIDASSSEIVSHTAMDQMTARARTVYEQHREAIEAAFSQARDS